MKAENGYREITIRLFEEDMPASIEAVSSKQDKYTAIYLNKNLPDQKRAASFLHEMLHVYHDDNTGTDTVQIEKDRRRELWDLMLSLLENDSDLWRELSGQAEISQ